MTILRDLYRPRRSNRPRAGRSGGERQQGQVRDQTLLDDNTKQADAVHRPNSEEARIAMGRRFGECLFLADWTDAVFLHFEVETALLQPEVPFPLDSFAGRCYVSLVAFTMRGMRFAKGGKLTRWLTSPIATHRFLNLRTYVRLKGETGIFFMKEWLDNRLSVSLGPLTFGLPYHYAALDYDHGADLPTGRITTEKSSLCYEGKRTRPPATTQPRTLDAFLLERYTAYTNAGWWPQYFRIWHPPWKQTALHEIELRDTSLLDGLDAPWVETSQFAGAHFSPGVVDVWMGRPHLASQCE